MEIIYRFKPEEVKDDFMLIGETYRMGSKPTETGRGKRLYAQMIPIDMQADAQTIIEKAKYAHSHGLKADIELTPRQIVVIKELVKYCLAL